MGRVRSPKSIGGAVGARLGNAPYKIGDRTFLEFIIKCPNIRFKCFLYKFFTLLRIVTLIWFCIWVLRFVLCNGLGL
uniref:Similarity. Hypothetical start n=1 Tax=Microcystis aeruginosa (strain PCC 7806) TaxID=267872 RepID=A8YFJ6_MICA7|nr:unnamed protein product [Microcystis aeruginosa PCC 7806]